MLSGASDVKTYYCTVTATDAAWQSFVSLHGTDAIYSGIITKYETSFTTELTVRYIKKQIVYLHPGDEEEINEVTYPDGDDDNDGKTAQTPVRTWQKAYSLLRDDFSWDDNIIVLIGLSDK